MRLAFTQAAPEDADRIAVLRTAVALDLMTRFGKGHWCSPVSVRAVLLDMRRGRVYVARQRNVIVATRKVEERFKRPREG